MTFKNLNLTKEQKELLQQISEEVELLKLIGAPQELYDELHKEARHILFNPPKPEEIFKVNGYDDTRTQLQEYLAKRFLYHCNHCDIMCHYDCAKKCHLWEKFVIDSLVYGLTRELIQIKESHITIMDLIYDRYPKADPKWVEVFTTRYGEDVFPIGTIIEIIY